MTEGLFIRADADERIGAGHVMRCLAIAQAWRDARRGPAWLASAALPDALLDRFEAEGVAVLRIARGEAALAGALEKTGATWVVLDGYELGPAHQTAVHRAGRRLLVVDDDGACGTYQAEVVLDHNLFADERRYARRPPTARLLLGPRYALLRRELRRRPGATPAPVRAPGADRVLVSMGGADPAGMSRRVIDALLPAGLHLTVVVGPANVRMEELARAAAASNRVELVRSAPDMAALMARADIAIVGAGVTCLELAHAGVPQIVVVTADNQRPVAAAFAEQGVARTLGDAEGVTGPAIRAAAEGLLADARERAAMAAKGAALVDGEGAARVVDAMNEESGRSRPR